MVIKLLKTGSVKNSREFSKAFLGESKEDGKVLLSFGVKALFLIIPVKEATARIEDWVHQQHEDLPWKGKVKRYIKLVKIYIEEN